MEIIQSKQNASIKSARKLLQRKHRKTSYLLEGWHLFEEAKASGADILQVFVLEEMANRVANMANVRLLVQRCSRSSENSDPPRDCGRSC